MAFVFVAGDKTKTDTLAQIVSLPHFRVAIKEEKQPRLETFFRTRADVCHD